MTPRRLWGDRVLEWLLPPEAAEEIIGDLREEWRGGTPGSGRNLRRGAAVASILVHFGIRRALGSDWFADARLAVRRLRRAPSFTAVSVLVIALGFGVNVSMLAVAETVLFAPLPYPDEHRLGIVSNDHSGSSTGGFGLSYDNARDVRLRARSIDALALYIDWQDVSARTRDGAIRIPAAFVSDDYSRLLGLETALGRFILPAENRENADAAVAVLGHGTWATEFGSDPSVIGRSLDLNGHPYTVIGVLADDRGDLRYAWGQDPVGIYLPLFAAERLVGFQLDGDRGARYLNALARVRPEVSLDEAQRELTALSGALEREFPRANEGWTYRLQPLDEALYESLRAPTIAILGISALVVALVAVNLVTLVLLRAVGRTTEVSVRRALGAGSPRIVQQMLSEGAVLTMVGASLGLVLAERGLAVLSASQAVRLPEFASLGIDGRVLAAFALAALFLVVLLGVPPAVALLRSRSLDGLNHGGRASLTRSRVRTQRTLVSCEVAIAFVLLIGAGLLLESFHTLRSTGYGFDTDRLLLAQVDLRGEEYGDERIRAFASQLTDQAGALPGVDAALIWSPNRLGYGNRVALLTPLGRWSTHPEERLEASAHTLHPRTIDKLGIRLLAGRDVSEADDSYARRVALVSEGLAHAFWPTGDAIGERLETREGGESVVVEIVGVVSDARHRTRLIEPFGAQLDVYYPFAQRPWRFLTLVLRHHTDAELDQLAVSVRQIVAELDPSVPIYGVTTMEQRMATEEGPARLSALLVTAYAVLAVSLAALGLYGVLAHGVRLRLQEIGIRMALGADRPRLLAHVVGRAVRLTAVGIAAGAVISVPAEGLLATALYGVEPGSARLYLVGLSTLLAVAIAASWIPARRATAVAPSDVLRAD